MVAAHAINKLYEQQLYNFTGEELRTVLKTLEVRGVTGINSFDKC